MTNFYLGFTPLTASTAAIHHSQQQWRVHPGGSQRLSCGGGSGGRRTRLRGVGLRCSVAATTQKLEDVSAIQGEDVGSPLGFSLQPAGLPLMVQHVTVAGQALPLVIPTDIYEVMDYYLAKGSNDLDPYWARPWPSGTALATQLLLRPSLVAGLTVCEVGAGLGMAGLAAALAGAKESVLMDREPLGLRCALMSAAAWGLTDLHPPSLLDGHHRQALSQLAPPPGGPIDAQAAGRVVAGMVDWNEPAGDVRYDVVLCCDVLYEEASVEPVAKLVQRLLAPGGRLILADPPNRTRHNRERFLELLRDCPLPFLLEESYTCACSNAGTDADVTILNLRLPLGSDTIGVRL